ncbi:hypothetical protein [Streptosporangium saharense]|uniref:hypothetical protein n=1 Tax=Streptosporangium saharense TaxID=1706840 RepID=UPI0036A7DFD1
MAPAQAAAAAGFALVNWLLDAACLAACLLAVGVSARPADSTVTVIPGGLGVIDSALILGLVTIGISALTAIAAVVLYRIVSFGFVTGTGWIFWLIIRYVPATRRGGGGVSAHSGA